MANTEGEGAQHPFPASESLVQYTPYAMTHCRVAMTLAKPVVGLRFLCPRHKMVEGHIELTLSVCVCVFVFQNRVRAIT